MSDVPTSLPLMSAKPVLPGLAIILSLVGALMAYGVLVTQYPFTTVPSSFDIGMGASEEARLALMSETDRVNRINATIIMIVGGGLLGAALAFPAVACCGLTTRLIAGVVWGCVWGGIAGSIGALAVPYIVPRGALPALTNVASAHGLLFGLFGAGLGAMVGGFTKDSKQIVNQLIKSGLAGMAGGCLYAVLVGFVAPGEVATQLVPANSIAQLLWLVVPFVALGASTVQKLTGSPVRPVPTVA